MFELILVLLDAIATPFVFLKEWLGKNPKKIVWLVIITIILIALTWFINISRILNICTIILPFVALLGSKYKSEFKEITINLVIALLFFTLVGSWVIDRVQGNFFEEHYCSTLFEEEIVKVKVKSGYVSGGTNGGGVNVSPSTTTSTAFITSQDEEYLFDVNGFSSHYKLKSQNGNGRNYISSVKAYRLWDLLLYLALEEL